MPYSTYQVVASPFGLTVPEIDAEVAPTAVAAPVVTAGGDAAAAVPVRNIAAASAPAARRRWRYRRTVISATRQVPSGCKDKVKKAESFRCTFSRVAEGVQHGRLRDPSTGPASGEHVAQLIASGGLVVEHILSGQLEAPVDYRQEEDEWVVLLTGSARLEADGESFDLGPGDWLFLPAGAPHRLVETTPGTSWLAVLHHART